MTAERYSFLHAADLHIDSPLRGLERYEEAPAEAIREASRRAFENLVERALELRVAFVILAGDVFDGDWQDFGTGLWFTARLRQLTREGCRVYLLAGNHDAQGRMTSRLEYPDGVSTFDTRAPQTLVDEPTGAVLHGQGFAQAATRDDLAAQYPAATPGALNIGVLHTSLNGREGHDDYAPTTPDTLRAKGYAYWALGHVHQREVVSREPWIVFPGNLQARHVREPGAKGATLVTVERGEITAVEHQPLDVVRFARLEVDVSTCDGRSPCEQAVARALAEARDEAEGRLLAARVVVTGRSAAHAALQAGREAFAAACRDRANTLGDVWLEKLELRTRGATEGSGRDIVEALDLEDTDLCAETLAQVRADLDALLARLPAGIDLAAEGLDLRDEGTLSTLLAEAREDIVRRLVDADGEAGQTP